MRSTSDKKPRSSMHNSFDAFINKEDAQEKPQKLNMRQKTQIDEKYRPQLLEMFGIFDLDGNHEIALEELMLVLNSLGHKLTENDVKLILTELDADENDMVDLREFSAVMIKKIEERQMTEQEKIDLAFSVFDIKGDGKIKDIDIQKIMAAMGLEVTEQEAKAMIAELDVDTKGFITYDQFNQYMKEIDCFRDEEEEDDDDDESDNLGQMPSSQGIKEDPENFLGVSGLEFGVNPKKRKSVNYGNRQVTKVLAKEGY